MSEQQKKIIPKFKKKLQGFLSDESGKITKEDVLKMGMIAMGVAGMAQEVNAWHSNINQCNVLAPTASHGNWGNTTGTATHVNSTATVYRGCTTVTDGMYGTAYVNNSIAPYSATVNGHANGNATINGGGFNGLNASISQGQSSHSNVSTHGAHGSGGWC